MKQEKDSLGNRMKSYEQKHNLPSNIPVIIRIDGRAFHTLTRGMKKPFDLNFIIMMDAIGQELCKEIQGCRLAYLQSDEISFLVLNNPEADTWFGNEIQKICSVSSSIASSIATTFLKEKIDKGLKFVSFDSRAFIIPKEDVVNYFIWRQKDWERNSLQMFSRSYFTQKELEGKKKEDMHDMLHNTGQNWNDLDTYLKRGRCVIKDETKFFVNEDIITKNKWKLDHNIPIFTENREYINRRLE